MSEVRKKKKKELNRRQMELTHSNGREHWRKYIRILWVSSQIWADGKRRRRKK